MWKKYGKWIIIAVAVVALAGGGFFAYTTWFTPQEETSADPEMQTAVAREGSLVVYAIGTGEVIAGSEIDISFEEDGTLTEVLVELGDEVEEGDVLALARSEMTEEEIALDITEAELSVIKAEQNLQDIYDNAELDAAEALQAYEAAEEALEELNNQDLVVAEAQQAVAEAEEAVEDAERSYNTVRSTASQSTIDAAYAEMVLAEESLKEAEDAYKEYADKADTNLTKANLQLKLNAAQTAYDSAVAYYNSYTSTGSQTDLNTTDADLAAAQALLAEAQEALEEVLAGPTAGEIAMAEAELTAAQREWESLKDGADPTDVALAEAELANAQAQLAEVQEQQAIIELVAPMDGTIMSIDATIGETVGSSAIIKIADLSVVTLEVYLDETDLQNVGVGYDIEVIFDALEDEIFTGKITAVYPGLQSMSGYSAILAIGELDTTSYAKPVSIPVGMSASVDVIDSRTEDAVLVPVEALREIGDDGYAVFVLENGEPVMRMVEVGIMDFTYAEIISGLQAGETVTTGIVSTN